MIAHVTRTRMAMGRAVPPTYSYDVIVPTSELARSRFDDVIIHDGIEYVTFEDATLPESHHAMPKGFERWDAWKAHEQACQARQLALARLVYPELADVTEWPGLWVTLPDFDASHDLRTVTFDP